MKLNIKALRNGKGWTLDHLSAISGISKGYLSQLETMKRQPSSATISTLAATFGVQVSALIETEQDGQEAALIEAFESMGDEDRRGCLCRVMFHVTPTPPRAGFFYAHPTR